MEDRPGRSIAPTETCPGCHITLPCVDMPTHAYIGASPSCWAKYGELLAREYGDPAYMRAHRQTVDAYAAQHPGVPGRRSSQSVRVHLLALYLVLERDWPLERVTEAMSMLVERQDEDRAWLAPPDRRGDINVLDVLAATNAAEHRAAVHDWAQSVWDAWSPSHPEIRAQTPI